MKIVIDIPDNYNLDAIKNGSIACGQILKAVKNGTPYNSSGDLISREALKKEFRAIYHCAETMEQLSNNMEDAIDNAPTVMPADK